MEEGVVGPRLVVGRSPGSSAADPTGCDLTRSASNDDQLLGDWWVRFVLDNLHRRYDRYRRNKCARECGPLILHLLIRPRVT